MVTHPTGKDSLIVGSYDGKTCFAWNGAAPQWGFPATRKKMAPTNHFVGANKKMGPGAARHMATRTRPFVFATAATPAGPARRSPHLN
jgi:hypothetical protein